jgi:hypothetical protein
MDFFADKRQVPVLMALLQQMTGARMEEDSNSSGH